ncbi:hypothetical protein BH10PAT2_BH10PAT2_2720 [soil metagenome]
MQSQISFLLHCAETPDQYTQATSFLTQKYDLSTAQLLRNPDLHWLNSDHEPEAGAVKIEQIREMSAEMMLRPFQGIGELKQAIFVICKIELASVPAQNALLKSLEEPPAHVQFLLTSTQPQRVLPTILSRVQLVKSDFTKVAFHKAGSPKQVEIATLGLQSYTTLMEMAGSYKEKPEAILFLKELLNTLHQDNILEPTSQRTRLIQETVTALEYLQKNINTRLVLEHLLFQFKSV